MTVAYIWEVWGYMGKTICRDSRFRLGFCGSGGFSVLFSLCVNVCALVLDCCLCAYAFVLSFARRAFVVR